MSPLLPLAAVFIFSGPVQAAGRACQFNTEARDIERGSPECAALKKMAGQFSRLAAAAGFEPGQLEFNYEVVPSTYFNAFYRPMDHNVTVFRGFVTCALKHEAAAPMVLAHEIGHAVQDREGLHEERTDWILRTASPEAAKAVSRRYESQADIIGGDLLAKIGLKVDAGLTTAAIFKDCIGNAAFISPGSHPAPNARVVEALHDAAQRQRELAERLPKTIRPFDAPGDPGDVAQNHNGYTLAPGRYKPRVPLEALNAQGRMTKGLLTNNDVPLPDQQLKLSDHTVTIVPGVVWRPPYTLMNCYSPDEVIAALTHARFPDKVDFREIVSTGVAYIVKYRLWELLPGQVTVSDPAMMPSPKAAAK
ncbi:MAG: M48 family metalloprotease [Elusimicrobia bacterium]|nr:M48 family metalloprotease [Elusimicrobiota bacterium]